MNQPQEVQTVVDLYQSQKHHFWSKVAKRIAGFHLFGNNSFTKDWIKTFAEWLNEFVYIEEHKSSMEILGRKSSCPKSTREFIIELATALEEHDLFTPSEGQAIRSNRTISVKPRNERAQAILVKLFFELSLMRPNWMHRRGGGSMQIKIEDLIDRPLDQQLTIYDDFGPITKS